MNEADIKLKLYRWLNSALGTRHQATITFDADFVAGNVINATVEGSAIDPVPFASSHTTTLKAVARSIMSTGKVWTAFASGARQITVVGGVPGVSIVMTGPIVTGGASQPASAIATVIPAASIQVYHADQAAPRPGPYPYATIRIDSIRKIGRDEIRMRDTDPDTLLTTVGGQRAATVTVNFYGLNALENTELARSSLETQSVENYFISQELSVMEIFAITDLSAQLETEFEQRASFDFYLGFAQNQMDNVGIVETVDLSGEVDDTIDVGPLTIGN